MMYALAGRRLGTWLTAALMLTMHLSQADMKENAAKRDELAQSMGKLAWQLTAEQKDLACKQLCDGTTLAQDMLNVPHALGDTNAARSNLKVDQLASALRPLLTLETGAHALANYVLIAPYASQALQQLHMRNKALAQHPAAVAGLEKALAHFARYEENMLRLGVPGHAIYQALQDPLVDNSTFKNTWSSFRVKSNRYNLLFPYETFLIFTPMLTGWYAALGGLQHGTQGALIGAGLGALGGIFGTLISWPIMNVQQGGTIKKAFYATKIIEKAMHRTLTETMQSLTALHKVYVAALQLPALDTYPALKTLQRYFDKECPDHTPEIRDLLKILLRSTFQDVKPGEVNPSFVKYHNLYAGIKALKQALPHLRNLLLAAGLLDTALLPLRLQQNSFPHGITWTAPHYIFTSYKPIVQMHQARQLLFPHSVSNSITLGGEDNRISLVTGPNGSGKTTLMLTVGQLILLAQSLGVVPAAGMALTPFAFLGSSKDIKDDVVQGDSLFAAEVKAIQELQRQIVRLPQGQFGFLFIDEPYAGTTEENGTLFTQQLIQEVDEYFKNTIMCLTSHHRLDFEHVKGTTIGHMEVIYRGGTDFDLTFAYKPGVADWWYNGSAEIREAFAKFFKRKQLLSVTGGANLNFLDTYEQANKKSPVPLHQNAASSRKATVSRQK